VRLAHKERGHEAYRKRKEKKGKVDISKKDLFWRKRPCFES
jgi:hypothetical protein